MRQDAHLEAMQAELKDLLATLNRYYHPVYPADVERVKVLEAQVAALRADIKARRREMATDS